jgi:hypothetical protein
MLLEVEEHVEVCGQKGILNDLIDRIVSVGYANGTENMGRLKTDKYLTRGSPQPSSLSWNHRKRFKAIVE